MIKVNLPPTVTVEMSLVEAGKLKHLLLNVDWTEDALNGGVAKQFFEKLDQAGILESYGD